MRLKLATAALATGLGATAMAPIPRAVANPYEAFIDVASEDDLVDLLAAGQISDDTYEALSVLLDRGVNLSTAGREELYSLPNLTYPEVDAILAYRQEQGFIADPAALVTAGALSETKLLAIAAFLVVEPPTTDAHAVHGSVQLMTRTSPSDFGIETRVDGAAGTPPMGLRARVSTAEHLRAGVVATLSRMQLGDIAYDPTRDALIADPAGVSVHVPKAFVAYKSDDVDAIVGSFRAGFGQRLTFDNSADYTPNGLYADDQLLYSTDTTSACRASTGELASSPCTGSNGDVYVTPDYRWRNGLFGVGAGARQIKAGSGLLQAYGWASYARRSIYQYELVDRGKCADPRNDADPACAAPDVYLRPEGDVLTPTATTKFATLPNVLAETLAGANLTYVADRRNYAGVTIYGAKERSLVDGIDLGVQEWSSVPGMGGFGAAGVNAAFGKGWLDLFAEVAHSLDGLPDVAGPVDGGGGPAAIVRATATGKKRELEISARYYDTNYVNPYSRPIAASDEFEGQRVRDEAGGRVRYTGTHGLLTVRGAVDVWANLTDGTPKADAYARIDVRASDAITWGVAEEFTDKDLSASGRGACYEVSIELDERGEPIPCSGMRLKTTGRIRAALARKLVLTGQVQHAFVDDPNYPSSFRNDLQLWLAGTFKPTPRATVSGRVRYLNEDIANPEALEESLWFTGDVALKLRQRDTLRLRADLFALLDERTTTLDRVGNPALWLWAQYQAKF